MGILGKTKKKIPKDFFNIQMCKIYANVKVDVKCHKLIKLKKKNVHRYVKHNGVKENFVRK